MAKVSPLYRLEVVPLTPLFGKWNPRFSYAANEPVPNGSLVSISFGKRTLTGVVLNSAVLPGRVPDWMKYVGPTLLPEFLMRGQITLAENLSELLSVQLGILLKLFFPVEKKPSEKKNISSESRETSATKKKQTARNSFKFRWEGIADESILFERLLALCRAAKKMGKPLFVLIPELLSAEVITMKLCSALPEFRIGTLSSVHTPRETYFSYEAIREGNLDIIIGTRQGVFVPFSHLAGIVVIDPEKRLSYTQWERMPRYDAVEIAELLAHQLSVPLYHLSVAPGLEYFAKKKLSFGKPFHFSEERDLAVIDMRPGYRSRKRGNNALSLELIQAARKNTKERKSMLCLVTQRGRARFSLCAKCQTVLRCPECETALTEIKSGVYHCLHCRYRAPLFPTCRNCHEMNFTSFGAGTEAVAQELSRAVAQECVVIDRTSQSNRKSREALIAELVQTKKPLLIVSTYEAAESLPCSLFGLIAMIEADQGLFYPDYQSEERLWRSLRRYGGKLAVGGKLFIQTFEPESKHWTSWIREPLSVTAALMLEERKLLHYPPYYHFIQLECRGTNKESSLVSAEKIESALRKFALEGIEIIPRYLPFNRKNHYHILIRQSAGQYLPERLRLFFRTLDPSVKITHNPVSLH